MSAYQPPATNPFFQGIAAAAHNSSKKDTDLLDLGGYGTTSKQPKAGKQLYESEDIMINLGNNKGKGTSQNS